MRTGCWLIPVLLVVALIALIAVPGVAAEWLWFDSLGQLQVYLLRFTTQAWLLFLVGVLTFVFLYINIVAARRLSASSQFVFVTDRRRQTQFSLDMRVVASLALAVSAVIALIAGLSATDAWTDYLRFINATPFGDLRDPILGTPVGFYVFELPLYLGIRGWLLAIIAIAFVIAVALYGGGRLGAIAAGSGGRDAGIVHLSILGALWLGVEAWSYSLQRYELLYASSGLLSGPGYTTVTARIPALTLLAVVVLLCIVALVANLFVRRLAVVWVALGVWFAVNVLAAGVYPELVQSLVVAPNELALEQPYLANAIEYTRLAYGLDRIQESTYGQNTELTAQDVISDAETLENIRLWDYRPLLTTFGQLQEFRRYYDFRDVDIEVYHLDGKLRQVMLAARELSIDQLAEDAQTWVNQHLIYTHGYGITAIRVNQVAAEGLPVLIVRDIPPVSDAPELNVTRPEIYYGEETTDYVIVDTREQEFDYPKGDDNVYAHYQGGGGVPSGNLLRRLMFALVFGSPEILLSGSLTGESRILYHRALRDRVETLAPFLLYDTDPYIAVVNGRLVWIQDAYTYDAHFPYSEHYTDPYSATGRDKASIAGADLNYVRNSVKVTVDAYDGTTTFWVVDPTDPVIQTWMKIYPSLFTPLERMDPGLRAMLRYPEGLFRTQAALYGKYHMRDPRVFYNREDEWAIANDLQAGARELIEPYYVVMRLPGRPAAEFVLMVPLTPVNKDNMIAWLYANSDGPDLGDVGVYKFSKQALIYGPMQIEGRINQDTTISAQLTLWNQQGSSVIRGNLLVIPVNGGLLYVEPLYLQSQTGQLPELKRVIVAYGTSIAMSETLTGALNQVFGVATAPPPSGGGGEPSADVAALAASAQQHYQRSQECLQQGDWQCYGAEQAALAEDLAALVAATKK